MPSSFKRERSLSVPLLFIFLGILFLTSGCDQTEKRFSEAMETAKSAYESGSYPIVVNALTPYLEVFPENLEMLSLLGRSEVRGGNPATGARLLQRTYEADPVLVHLAKEAGQAFQHWPYFPP